MPTLEEIYAQQFANEQTELMESLFDTSQIKPTQNEFNWTQASKMLEPSIPPEQQGSNMLDSVGTAIWESTAQPAFTFADSVLFGLPGLAAKKVIGDEFVEDWLTPKTTAGKVTSAIAGTAGFLTGPVKAGAKLTTLAARPFIKGFGKKTVKEFTKDRAQEITKKAAANQFTTSAKKKFLQKDLGEVISSVSARHKWDIASKGAATNFNRSASKAISRVVDEARLAKKITSKEAATIKSVYQKNVSSRPMQDFVDLAMSRNPNTFGWFVGNAIQEASVFGMIDAAIEGVHSLRDERDYDWMAPVWGAGVGIGFGVLRLMPAAGKMSVTGKDFRSGLRALWSKNPYNEKMGWKTTERHADIIGKSLKFNGQKTTFTHKGIEVDLANPFPSIASEFKTKKAANKFLKEALNANRKKYGKEMMKASLTEDFQSSLANWKRVLLGTAIMNARSSIAIAQGHEMDNVDIMTSLMIGAFINRRGRPLEPEMNMKKMREIRSGLHAHGIRQPGLFNDVPTLHDSQHQYDNPLTDERAKPLLKEAEDLGIVGDVPERVESSNSKIDGTPVLAASERVFPLFDAIYPWLNTASKNKYLKPRELVTEREAERIEARIREMDVEGKPIDSVDDLNVTLKDFADNITDKVEFQLRKTGHDIINITDWGTTKSPSDEDLGTIPDMISIQGGLKKKVLDGDYPDISANDMTVANQKGNAVLDALNKSNNATKTQNPNDEVAVIKTPDELRKYIELLKSGENSFKETFNSHNRLGDFKFETDLEHMVFPILTRKVQKGHETYSNFFGETTNPDFESKMLPLLKEVGLIQKDPNKVGGYKILDYHNIELVRPEGFATGNEESLLRTTMAILALKGNKSLPIDTHTKSKVDVAQVAKLDEYLSSNGIATQKELLDYFRNDMVQHLFADMASKTKITGADITILNELASFGLPLARYSSLAEGGTGFTLSKIDVQAVSQDKRLTQYKAVVEYNEKVDIIIENGTTKDGTQLIKPGEEITFRPGELSKYEAETIRTIITRAEAKGHEHAMGTLKDFVTALEPNTTLRESITKYLEDNYNDPSALFNFLQGEGLIASKKKKGTIEYYIKANKAQDLEVEERISNWLSKFGVHTNDVEKMITTAQKNVENILDGKDQGNDGTITQQDFFNKYYPDADNVSSRYPEAQQQKDYIDGALAKDNPVKEIIDGMDIKIGDNVISGKAVWNNRKYSDKLNEIKDDVQKILVLRNGDLPVDVLSIRGGEVVVNKKNVQKNNFTKFLEGSEIPFVFVDGEAYTQYYSGGRMRAKSFNVFELDSPASSNQYSNNKQNKDLYNNFFEEIKNYDWGQNVEAQGVSIVRMGNAKDAIAIPTSSFKKVSELFKKEIIDVYSSKLSTRRKQEIESMWKNHLETDGWSDAHEDAMRTIIVKRMVTGKNDPDRIVRILEGNNSEDLADIGKRFSLYHTPSFKRMDLDLVKNLSKNASGSDKRLLNNFMARKIGMLVWNDEGAADLKADSWIQKRLSEKKSSWEDMIGTRKGASRFDSITFISEDFKRILELYYGVSAKGSNVFKPIISSNGDENLFFAKTVFIYDKDLQTEFFSKKKDLDILTTVSGDKMKSSISDEAYGVLGKKQQQNAIRHVNKGVEDLVNMDAKEISDYMTTLDMNSIGVTIIPDVEMNAKQSYSLGNYHNNDEHSGYFDAFYKKKLEKLLGHSSNSTQGQLQMLAKDAMHKRLALLKLKGDDFKTAFDNMGDHPASMKNLGHHVQVAALGGDVRMLGEDVLFNSIKSQLLDPILSPESVIDGQQYGGKSVIKQSLVKFRELDITVRTGEGDKTNINPGEIVLGHNYRDGNINFADNDIALRAVDKKGNVSSLRETMTKLWTDAEIKNKKSKEEAESIAKDNWDLLVTEDNLGQLFDELQDLTKDFSIGILTTRYPRTTPNDLAILKLKGFQDKEQGNTAIVNDFDVFNIFEGDYDVDEVDFFWGMNRDTWKHTERVKHHWVNTVNPDFYKPTTPDLKLAMNGKHNADWNAFDGNNRIFKKGIGIVQKTPRLLAHLDMIGSKNTEEGSVMNGMTELMEYSHNGNRIRIVMDYDNANHFERLALESQLVIDYWKGVNKDIAQGMVDWRNEYLFPKWDESITKEQAPTLRDRAALAKSGKTPKTGVNNKRIRIFRKFVERDGQWQEGKNDELVSEEKTVIQHLLSENSKFLGLTSEVYDNSGAGRNPSYDDMFTTSNDYFNGHLRDIGRSTYYKVRSKHKNSPIVKSMFRPIAQITSSANKVMGKKVKYNSDSRQKELDLMRTEIAFEKANPEAPRKHTYLKHIQDPFINSVKENAKEIAKSGGKRGSAMERVYREVLFEDPFGHNTDKYGAEIPLSGDRYVEMMSVTSDLLNPYTDLNSSDNIRDYLPKMIGSFNKDIASIKHYKRTLMQVINSKDLKKATKDKRVDGLKKVITELEQGIKELLPKEYLESQKIKDLEKIKTVSIARDKDVIEGTVQWWTLKALERKWGNVEDSPALMASVNDAIVAGGKYYSELEYGSSMPLKNVTVHTDEQMKMRMDRKGSFKDVEELLTEKLEKGFQEHKMPFLIRYAMPVAEETKIGVYNHIPMPISSSPSGRLKRVTKFILDKMNTVQSKQEKLLFKEAAEVLVKNYAAYRNYFDGNLDALPTRDQDFMAMLDGPPPFSDNLKTVYSRYDKLGIETGRMGRDVFGLGADYNATTQFYRRLVNEANGGKDNAKLVQSLSTLSYTNQLLMESGNLDPITHYLMTRNTIEELSKLGLDKAEIMGIEGGESSPINIYSKDSGLAILAGQRGGVSILPQRTLGNYDINMIKKYIEQSRNLKKYDKVEKTLDEIEEMVSKGYCKPSAT